MPAELDALSARMHTEKPTTQPDTRVNDFTVKS